VQHSLAPDGNDRPDGDDDVGASALVAELAARGGLAFDAYAEMSLLRRIRQRMTKIGARSFAEYSERLASDPDEHAHLCISIPVHRTEFFRDEEQWADLARTVVAPLAARVRNGQRVRIWCAGCASGDEAYTLAILLADAVGIEPVRKHVRILATDVSAEAIEVARRGEYAPFAVRNVPAELLARYFDRRRDAFTVCPELARTVIFARHDLLRDPPFRQLDLLACRNTLMYFKPAAQKAVIAGFFLAVAPEGVLFTGPADGVHLWSAVFERDPDMRALYRPRKDGKSAAFGMLTEAVAAHSAQPIFGISAKRRPAPQSP